MKKIRNILIAGLVFGMVGAVLVGESMSKGWWNGSDDYRLGVFGGEGIALVAISPARGLVNQIIIDKRVNLWIPEGLGWYQTGRIGKLLDQEKKWDKAKGMAFYNYGFWPNKILRVDNLSNWDNWSQLVGNCGLINGIRLKLMVDKMLFKNDEIWTDPDVDITLNDWLVRDYADSKLLDDESKVSIVNASGTNGVADWLSKRINWLGLTVVGTETAEGQKDCEVRVDESNVESTIPSFMMRILGNCKRVVNKSLRKGEVELVVGEEWVKMIQYSNYVRTL